MSRLVKIVDNKYVQIEEYKNPNICFNTNEYDNFEDYCTLRETFDPFEIFYENQELKKQLEEYKDNYNCLLKQKEQFEYIMSKQVDYLGQKKEFINYMNGVIDVLKKEDVYDEELRGYIIQRIDTFKEILQKYKEITGVSDDKK